MFKGETVFVEVVEQVGVDELNEPITEVTEIVQVDNVLVEVGDTQDLRDVSRDGDKIVYTLRWPKDAYMILDNLRIKVRDEWFLVVGAPRQFDPTVCPTDWNMTVRLEVCHG